MVAFEISIYPSAIRSFLVTFHTHTHTHMNSFFLLSSLIARSSSLFVGCCHSHTLKQHTGACVCWNACVCININNMYVYQHVCDRLFAVNTLHSFRIRSSAAIISCHSGEVGSERYSSITASANTSRAQNLLSRLFCVKITTWSNARKVVNEQNA